MPRKSSSSQIGPNEYIIEGSMKLDDINDALELSLDSEDYDSIGGLIIELLDHLPQVGEPSPQQTASAWWWILWTRTGLRRCICICPGKYRRNINCQKILQTF